MKTKKIVSLSLAAVMLCSLSLSCLAEESSEQSALQYGIRGSNIAGVATDELLTEFTYVSKSDSSASVSIDVDQNVGVLKVDSDFESNAVNEKIVGPYNGSDGYTGSKSDAAAATVVSNPRASSGPNYSSNCIEIGVGSDYCYTAYDGGAYDATFWMYQNNPDWGRMNLQLKPDVYLAFRGSMCTGGSTDTLGLYCGYSDPWNNPSTFVSSGEAMQIASVNLDSYGYHWADGAVYYRVVVTYNTVKVYISPKNNFEGVKPIIDVRIPNHFADDRSMLQFSQGNTGLWVDDITVNDISATDSVPTVNGDEGKKLVYDEDFETVDTLPNNTSISFSGDNGRLAAGRQLGAVLAKRVAGDYTASFYLQTPNAAWDRVTFSIRNGYCLSFRGSSASPKDADGNVLGGYCAGITNNNAWNEAVWYNTVEMSSPPTSGCRVKIEVTGNQIKVWLKTVAEYSESGYSGDPTLEYTMPDGTASLHNLEVYDGDTNTIYIDDLYVDCEAFTYENSFDNNIPSLSSKFSENETTGNTVYLRNGADGDAWVTDTLFKAPKNYEMTFFMRCSNVAYTNAMVYLRNNIYLALKGWEANTGGARYIKLLNGQTELGSYVIGSISDLGNAPYEGGYVKVIFKDTDIKVYASKTEDFASEYLIIEATLESLDDSNRAIRIHNGNTSIQYDNFKVYDLDTADKTKIGSSYKKLLLSGSDMTFVNVTDNGTSVDTISSYKLAENARYRIAVGKGNGKITVYVNGKSVMTADSTAAGLAYHEGDYIPKVSYTTDAPTVISAGDLNYDTLINSGDLVIMRQILLGIENSSDYYTEAVNVNADAENKIDILDLVRLKKLAA